jgi:acyl-CoA dehydrogenase
MIRDQTGHDSRIAAIRRFVREVAMPNEDRVEREDAVGPDLVAAMQAIGTFGWSIPEDFGGAGLTTEELALAFIELSQCSVAFRVVGGTNAGIGSECLIRDGTPEQKQRYLPRLASGDLLGCLALTEEGAGSDATALQTRATQQPDGDYVLNGTKRYITLAPIYSPSSLAPTTARAARPACRPF